MDITLSIPHAFYAGSPLATNADALRALLDCMVQLDRAVIRRYSVPALYRSGVVYGRTDLWETIPALYTPKASRDPSLNGRAYGDCKSLASALIAEYLEQGIDASPVFRWAVRDDGSGNYDFHILVMVIHPDGSFTFEDPSRELGMGANEVAKFYT